MIVLMISSIGWLNLDETGFRFSKSVRFGLTAHPTAIIIRIIVYLLVVIVHLSAASAIHAIVVLIVVASVVQFSFSILVCATRFATLSHLKTTLFYLTDAKNILNLNLISHSPLVNFLFGLKGFRV